MTRYSSTLRQNSGSSTWEKREIRNKWQNLLAVFVTLVLVFALISGIGKSLSFGKLLGSSTWDGSSSVSAILNTEVPSILVYQTYPKHLVLLTLDGNSNFATGNITQPVRTLGSVFEGGDGAEMVATVSKIAHVPISNFTLFSTRLKIDEKSIEDQFKQFASIATPFKILIKGTEYATNTDFTRKDLFRLWWQVKSMNVNDIEVLGTSSLHEEIVLAGGQKVLGIDDTSLNALLAKYLENRRILEAKEKVVVVNASGVGGAGKLAADYVSAVGGSVDKIEVLDSPRQNSSIIAQKSYTAVYLAKLFDCDITNEPNMEKDSITIFVGRDFSKKYSL